ncbi:transposase [Acinetobacter calcoaceticus]|uniref:Transposase n=1 Tax=Acinetobacter calcoaceticus TaxID=471 RepID=A0A4R1XE52_ACICA|nr:transposase [Acinetobacter calcoaceticus]
MTYPVHFRKKVLTKLEEGMSIRDLADKYDLSPTTIQQWKKKLEPKPDCVRKPFKIDDQALRDDVAQFPTDYHTQRAERFNCSAVAISKALKRLGLKVKSSRSR